MPKYSIEYINAVNKIFDALPHGTIARIARELRIPRQSIYAVKDFRYRNDEILEAVKTAAYEHKQKERELLEFVTKNIA